MMLKNLTAILLLGVLTSAWPLAAQTEEELDELMTQEERAAVSFSTDVQVVTVPVVVRGPKGVYVNGLEKFDFTVRDNNKPQEITGFDISFQPISMVICVQTSDRVEAIIDQVRKTAYLFTGTVLGEFGEAAVINYDSRVELLSDFTNDPKEIQKALESFRTGSSAIRTSDAVYKAIGMLVKRPTNHKRVIVVISEGLDNGSFINLGETVRTAQLHNIMIYPIYLSTLKARLKRPPPVANSPFPAGISPRPAAPGSVATPTTYQQSRWNATPNMIPLIIDLVVGVKNLIFKDALAVLARGTGAEDYKPLTSEGLQESIVKIGEDLRSQYLLSYTPNNLNEKGIYHEIEVSVPYPDANVRSRTGYFYGPRPVYGQGEAKIVEE